MNKTIDRLKWLFLSAFVLSCVAVIAYQVFYVRPRDACEAAQNWWDPQTRICAVPYALGPVDRDGDGGQDFLVYGQEKNAGFRAWFTLLPDGTLVAGEHEVWEYIPE